MLIKKDKVAYAIRVDEVYNSFVETQNEGPLYDNPFLESLDNLTPDDIAPPVEKAKPSLGDQIFSIVRYALMGICALVFVGCMVYIGNSLYQYKKANDYYSELADGLFEETPVSYYSAVSKLSQSAKCANLYNYDTFLQNLGSGVPAISIIEGTTNLQYERIKAKLRELQSQNKNNDLIFGWIKVDNTNINYPMVKGSDNAYYLKHSPSGDYLSSGSIFVDFRNGPSLAHNLNTVIYGHNQANDTMFSNIDRFIKSEKIFNESKIVIYAPDGIYTYEPYSVMRVKANYPYFRTDFSSAEDFLAFAQDMQSKSIWKKDMTLTAEDRLITLSTCDNITTDGRYALHARLVSIER